MSICIAKKSDIFDTFRIVEPIYIDSDNDFVTEHCKKRGYSFKNGAKIKISVSVVNSRELTYIEENRKVTDEKYIIKTEKSDSGVQINIICSGNRSCFYALNRIFSQFSDKEIPIGTIIDYPLFSMRGYIEGFYGEPWNFDQREDMLNLMAQHNMNTYFYAPKDDEYHRDKWDELYPENETAGLKRILKVANDNYFDFWFCLAPGLSMKYSSEDDYKKLTSKLRQLYDIGIKNFGLLLDDIPAQLYYEEDIERFGSETVTAHIYLANKLYDTLKSWDKNINMALCPLQYHGNGDEYFISKLGQGIEPEIKLFWTGHNICSQEITVPEAVKFIDSTRHKPLYWDNFPVNDAEMYNEMHLGYITGRDPELYRYCDGLISNCMEYFESSKIPLLTVADYLWSPETYNTEKSWDYALETVVGVDWETFKHFADHLQTSCLKTPTSLMLCTEMDEAVAEIRTNRIGDGVKRFACYVKGLKKSVELIELSKDIPLYKELSRWSEKYILMCNTLELCCDFLYDRSAEKQSIIAENLKKYLGMPEVLADFLVHDTILYISKM